MPSARVKHIKCNIEPEFAEIMESVADKHKVSTSSYIRMLIINDLVARGLLTTETIARVTAG